MISGRRLARFAERLVRKRAGPCAGGVGGGGEIAMGVAIEVFRGAGGGACAAGGVCDVVAGVAEWCAGDVGLLDHAVDVVFEDGCVARAGVGVEASVG